MDGDHIRPRFCTAADEQGSRAAGTYLEPAIPVNDDGVVRQRLDGVLDELDDPVGIALSLLQLGSRDPYGWLCGDGLPRSVQHLLRVLVAFQARQCQPQLRVLRAYPLETSGVIRSMSCSCSH